LQDARQTGYLCAAYLPHRSHSAMDSFEINKVLGALLGTCLFLQAVHIASGAIFSPPTPAKPGYEIAVTEQPAGGGAPQAPAEVPIETLLPTASVQKGTADVKVCQACHNFQKGEGNKVGPDLYGVVGRPVASVAGFNYSAPLKAKGGTWTFDALNTWLTNPRADVPGTLMTFAGIDDEKERADVIDYLNSNSDNPLPLPKAAQAAPAPANPPANAAAPAPGAPPAKPAAPAQTPPPAAKPAAPPASK
jgi:cytochrome c